MSYADVIFSSVTEEPRSGLGKPRAPKLRCRLAVSWRERGATFFAAPVEES
jgi:hypothetical protein